MIVILKFDEPCKGQLNLPTDFVCVEEFKDFYHVMVKINSNYQNFYRVRMFEVLP